ncbi:hypothetical protein [Sphingomonas sp.]|uniref:hypothetical protein n=1 Tax=Sphingomonas sp. TaxID=28214 RepID=UPI0025DF5BAC|nr:hypothetical protein [Sphingomonas sp.]
MRVIFVLSAASATIAFGAALAQLPATPPPGPGLTVINEKCGSCHPPSQALQVRKSRADWTTTVQAMIDRGADLDPEEQATVIDYLATHFAPPASGAVPAAAPPPKG